MRVKQIYSLYIIDVKQNYQKQLKSELINMYISFSIKVINVNYGDVLQNGDFIRRLLLI